MSHLAQCGRSRTLLRLFLRLFLSAIPPSAIVAADEVKRVNFDLPPDVAEASLKRFSSQAGCEVLFAPQITDGVRTNAVKGTMTRGEALRRLLAQTGLVAVADAKTGAFSVNLVTLDGTASASPAGHGLVQVRPTGVREDRQLRHLRRRQCTAPRGHQRRCAHPGIRHFAQRAGHDGRVADRAD